MFFKINRHCRHKFYSLLSKHYAQPSQGKSRSMSIPLSEDRLGYSNAMAMLYYAFEEP